MKIQEIKQLYSKKDKMHNWNHILRIKRKVRILRKDYKKIDEDLLKFLILFHGLKDYVGKNQKRFDKEYIKSLVRHTKDPIRIEEKIVHDANMIENVGKFGVKKALFVGGMMRDSQEQTFLFLRENLKNVKFYTKKGKGIGKKEVEIMKKIIK